MNSFDVWLWFAWAYLVLGLVIFVDVIVGRVIDVYRTYKRMRRRAGVVDRTGDATVGRLSVSHGSGDGGDAGSDSKPIAVGDPEGLHASSDENSFTSF